MQRILLWALVVALMVSCNQVSQKKAEIQNIERPGIVAATIEELVTDPIVYKDHEVAFTGMVTHVCRHGGQKCFVLGEDGETQIRVVPGDDIDEFKIDLEGSTVAFRGILRVLTPELAAAHIEDHESKEHHATEMAHTEAEKADVYIETIDFREITE
jgi:hypothetical protein